jgi:hypothetical protein
MCGEPTPRRCCLQVVSSTLLGAAVGSFTGGGFADALGRRKAFMLCAVPMLVGPLLSAFASDLNSMVAGRFLAGLAIGLSSALVPLYVSEVGTFAVAADGTCTPPLGSSSPHCDEHISSCRCWHLHTAAGQSLSVVPATHGMWNARRSQLCRQGAVSGMALQRLCTCGLYCTGADLTLGLLALPCTCCRCPPRHSVARWAPSTSS